MSRVSWILALLLALPACNDTTVWGSRDPGGRDPGAPDAGGEEADEGEPPDEGSEAEPQDDGIEDEGPVFVDPGAPDPGPKDPGPPPEPATLEINANYLKEVLPLINGAKTSIQVCMLEFLEGNSPDKIQNALIAAAKRGVKVQVLLDESTGDTRIENQARADALVAAGAQAKLTESSKTLHVKLVVVDRARALVGSTNWSNSSLAGNNEANLLFTDPAIAEAYAQYAEALWGNDYALQALPASPVNGARLIGDGQYADAVVPVISKAQSRIRLIMYQLNWSTSTGSDVGRLVNAILDRKAHGVDVKVVLENSKAFSSVTDANLESGGKFKAKGIEVRMDSLEGTTHAKLVIADDTVVVYSGNWVESALNGNHEAGAVVTLPGVLNDALNYFDYAVWGGATAL